MKGIADLLDSDVEESAPLLDENSILSSASDAPNATAAKATQAKKGRKRQRVTMPAKAKSKAPKAASSQAKRGAPKQTAGVKRKASDDQVDQNSDEDVDEALENGESEEDAPMEKPKKRARPAAKAKAVAKPPKAQDKTHEDEDDLVEQSPVAARSKQAATKTTKRSTKAGSKAPAKPKAAPQSRTIVIEEQPEEVDETTGETEPASPPKPRSLSRDTSRTRQDPPFRRRAGSASDTERGDPNLRRKLGDITRKFENVDLKYRNLKEVGINEANANMEKLRRQCDATVQASNDLIASLKKELATQAPLAQETRKLRKQMQNQEEEMEKMRATTTDLSGSLAAAQNEIKTLQAKLAAGRAPSIEHGKTPGSAIKRPSQRSMAAGNAEAAKAAETAQMKLDLYSDLTGLVVLNAKKTEEGDTYECIQTGQNGSESQLSLTLIPFSRLTISQRYISSSLSTRRLRRR